MAYADEVLADSPGLYWKLGEADAATVAVDSSGNGRAGTYAGSPNLGEPALIVGDVATCMLLDGTARYANLAPESFINNLISPFAVEVILKPQDDVQRGILWINNKFQLYRRADGLVGFFGWIAGDWRHVLSTTSLVSGTPYHVGIEHDGTNMRIWLNGAQDAILAQGGTAEVTGYDFRVGVTGAAPAYFNGYEGHVAIYDHALASARWTAHYTAAITTPNYPPTVPGAFVHPLVDEEVDDTLTVEWGAGTDPDGDTLNYVGEYTTNNGGSWLSLFSLQAGLTYVWDTSAIEAADEARVRVKTVQVTGGSGESAWLTSALFTISHVSTPPLMNNLTVLRRTDNSIFVKADYFDPDLSMEGEHLASQWRIYEGEVLKLDTGWLETVELLTKRWFTALPANTELKIQVRARDVGGQIGAWSSLVTFRTRRMVSLGLADGFNQPTRNEGTDASITMTYGELIFGSGFVPGYPDLQPYEQDTGHEERGVRFRWNSGLDDYVQLSEPNGVVHAVRYGGAQLTPTGDHSIVMVLKPEFFDPAAKSVLFGSETWWVYRNNGSVRLRTAGNENFLIANGLLNYEQSLLIITYRYEEVDTDCMLATIPVEDRITVPGIAKIWLNGVGTSIGTLNGGPTMFPSVLLGGCPELSNAYQTTGMGWGLGAVPHNYLWLGSQSSDGARVPGDSNYYSYAGMFRDFAWMTDVLLVDDDADAMWAAFQAGTEDGLAAEILSHDPILYDRFAQPRAPETPVIQVA